MTTPAVPSYAGYRFPAEVISHAVWLYFRFPLSLRMVDELLAVRGIIVSHETVRQWALKFGQAFANQVRRRLPAAGDKWHLDEVVLTIAGVKHWLWRAVDQNGTVLDILVQSRRDTQAAKRLLRKLLHRHCRAPRVIPPASLTGRPDCIDRRSAGSVSVGVIMEDRFQDGLQIPLNDFLGDSVGDRRYPQRPYFRFAVALWDVDPSNRWRKVAPRGHAVPELVEVVR